MRQSYHSNISFLDLLFNFLLGLVMITVIAVLTSDKSEADIKTKAEFAVILKWTDHHDNDIDLWIEDPVGNVMWFRNEETGVMSLDRDDLGHSTDKFRDVDGEWKILRINQEMATIRGIMPGEWIINIHMYKQNTLMPTDVNVQLIKLNPKAQIIIDKTYKMSIYWQEITVTRFTMTEKGTVFNINDLEKNLIEQKLTASAVAGDDND